MTHVSNRLALLAPSFIAIGGCTHRRASPTHADLLFPARVAPIEALEAEYLAPLPFSVHYGIFRDVDGPAWGKDKVLAAYWRRDLGFESSIQALAHSPELQIVLVEGRRHGPSGSILHLVDPSGVSVATTANRSWTREIAAIGAKDAAGVLVFDSNRLHIMGPDKTEPLEPVEKFVTADLKGDGQRGFIVHDSSGTGRISAYGPDGRKRWAVPGTKYVTCWAAGRLGDAKGDSLVVFEGGFQSISMFVMDGRGEVVFSTPAGRNYRLASVGNLGDGPRIVTVSDSHPNTRDALMVSEVRDGNFQALSEADLGWARAKFLVLADLQGDGRKEIIVGTENGWVLVFSAEGRLLSERAFSQVEGISHLVAGDINGDGTDELLVAENGIPPSLYAVGVVPDPGPWQASPKK